MLSATANAVRAAALTLLALVSVATSVPVARAQGDPPITVFVESKSAGMGQQFSTDVIAILPPGARVDGFSLSLSFEGSALRPLGSRIPDGWMPVPQQAASTSGRVDAAGTSQGGGCSGPGSCVLASFAWEALSSADTSIVVAGSRLANGSVGLLVVDGGSGLVHISPKAALPAEAQTSAAGLGTANALLVIGLVSLLAMACALPIAYLLRLRRVPTAAPSAPAPGSVLDGLAQTAAGYFEELELAGRLFLEPDALLDQMARETASRSSRG